MPDTMRDVLTISDFNAEAMEKQDRFGPVPKYDEAGNVIEYRVVQTELHRDDDNRHETYDTPVTESLTGHQAITVNGDQYEIRMTQDGDQYFFEYKIVGDQIIHIVKAWNDEENPAYAAPGSEHPTHADDIIEALVNHYNFTTNEYENAWIDDNEYTELNQQDHLIAHSNKRETWKTSIHAPMYDNEGHEYNYQVLEHNTFPNYDVKINFDPATNTYTIANVYSPDDTPGIEFEKEWQDDGDMLHRTPVHIWVDAAVYHTQQITTLQETNVWLEEVQRNDTYTYNPLHFKEFNSSVQDDFLTVSDINAPNGTNDKYKWIYAILTERTNGQVSMKDKNPIAFNSFVGLYKNNNHYYAVQYYPDSTTNTDHIRIVNTRIGVVNYEVEFDWKTGDWLNAHEADKIQLKITPYIGDEPLDVEPIIQEILIRDTKKNNDENAKYILTDLPKYDNQGRIIQWHLEEISIADQVVTNGVCILKDENNEDIPCTIAYTEPSYENGTDHHSDDLISMKITNTFSDKTQMTIYKRWFDDNNRDGLRNDIHIRLYQVDHTGQAVVVGNDYEWTKPEANNNFWSYTFSNLEKYDSNGYPLSYKVSELSVSHYKTEYYSVYHPENPVASIKADDSFVENGGTIVNTIYGEVQIKGTKLWQNISPVLNKEHYPVAVIYLSRRTRNGSSIRIGQTAIYNGDSQYCFTPDKIYSSETPYYVVNLNGTPKTRTDGTVVLPKYSSEGQRYYYSLSEESIKGYAFKISNDKIVNEYNGGRPIQITVTKNWENMNEQSIYPNVEFTLHQVMFAQTRNAQGKILQNNGQYVDSTESTDPKLTFVSYTTYTKTLRKEEVQNHQWSYTFGEMQNGQRVHPKENLRQFAPDGSCFDYYVTEKLSNYEGESIHLNATDEEGNYLGDFYHAVMVDRTQEGSPLHSGLGFTLTELEQPEEITDSGSDHYTEDNKDVVIERTSNVTNSYEPDKENFEGKIVVNKTWNNHKENQLNSEFDSANNYMFVLSRKTTKIDNQTIFEINTWDSSQTPPRPTIINRANDEFTIDLEHPMKRYDYQDQEIPDNDTTTPVNYYKKEVYLTKEAYTSINEPITVTIKIYKRQPEDADYTSMHNRVEIEGLAIYAQDATRYVYTVTEQKQNAYKAVEPQSKKIGDNDTAEFTLNNELDVFTLNLYKIFGKTYILQDTDIAKTSLLSSGEYDYYFNQAFAEQLSFTLQRKKGINGTYEDYRYDNDSHYTVSRVVEDGVVRYKKQFISLPKYSPDGELYYYQVKEADPPAQSHYTTTYSESNSVGDSTLKDVSCGSADDNKSTYVCNSFEAKQIIVNKYWNDENNADGLRPENLRVMITEMIPNLPQQTINHVLKNADSWNKSIELPMYYYNGAAPIAGLQYGIAEHSSSSGITGVSDYNITAANYTLEECGYESGSIGSLVKHTFDNHTDTKEISDADFTGLYLQNQKDRINSQLTFSKSWDDHNDLWGLRPENISIKILRTSHNTVQANMDGIFTVQGTDEMMELEIRNLSPSSSYIAEKQTEIHSNGSTVSVWRELSGTEIESGVGDSTVKISLNGLQPQEKIKIRLRDGNANVLTDKDGNPLRIIINGSQSAQEIVKTDTNGHAVRIQGTSLTADETTGVITIPTAQANSIVIENLAYGENVSGDMQNNGDFRQYFYTVVECDSYGHDTQAHVTTANLPQADTIPISKTITFRACP